MLQFVHVFLTWETQIMQVNDISTNVVTSYNKFSTSANDILRRMPVDNFSDAITAAYDLLDLSTNVALNANVASRTIKTKESLINSLY
jgi:hypothetical protein